MVNYSGYVEKQLLFSNTRPDEYGISTGTINRAENAASQCEFTLSPGNISADLIVLHKSLIEVKESEKYIFRGIVSTVKKNYDGSRSYVAIDLLGLFGDILSFSSGYKSKTISTTIDKIIDDYNQAVETPNKLIQRGNVTITGTFSIETNEKYVSLSDILSELISSKGGYVQLRYGPEGITYLDYLQSIEIIGAQEVIFGENLLDIAEQMDTNTLLSRVYPTGTDGITIPGGYLINEAIESRYGRIDKPYHVDSDDVETVKKYAQAYLTRYAVDRSSITLTAIDLSVLDKSLNSFEVGQKVNVISSPHDIDTTMQVTEMTTDLVDPAKSRLTLGMKSRTLTGAVNKTTGGTVQESEVRNLKETVTAQGEQLESLSEDYIVAQGTSGIWTYRKWASGVAECWGVYTISNAVVNVAWGNVYETANYYYTNFPSGLFSAAPVTNLTVQGTQGVNTLSLEFNTGPTKDRTQWFYITRATAGTMTCYIAIHAIGRWK